MNDNDKTQEYKFEEEYVQLCIKYGLQIVCEDPFCGLEIEKLGSKLPYIHFK